MARLAVPSRTSVWAVVPAIAVTAALLAVSGRYGWSRDELYFRVLGEHPAFGYVDQPPLAPLATRAARAVGGDTVEAVRVLPAFVAGLVVATTTRITARLGGGRREQVLAGVAVGVSPILLGSGHLAGTTVYDLLTHALVSLLVVRVLTGDVRRRTWLALGLVLGVGLEVKLLAAAVAGALAVGLLATPHRRLARTAGPWLALAVAAALVAPYAAWQASHGWPTVGMTGALSQANGGPVAGLLFAPMAALVLGPPVALVWVPGLVGCWRDRTGLRAVAVSFVLLVVVFAVSGGKPYYVAGLLPLLVARGALAWRGRARAVTVAVGAAGLATVWLSVPVLPVRATGALGLNAVNYDLGEQDIWPSLVTQVRGVVDALPPAQRTDAVLVARNYGEAGALALCGPDLPTCRPRTAGTCPTPTLAGRRRGGRRRWCSSGRSRRR